MKAACASYDIILKRFVAVVGLESSLFSWKLVHFGYTQNPIRELRVVKSLGSAKEEKGAKSDPDESNLLESL